MDLRPATLPANCAALERHLSCALDEPVRLIQATRMKGGFRNRLWRLDVLCSGMDRSIVLRIPRKPKDRLIEDRHPHDLQVEYDTMCRAAAAGLAVPLVWGLDASGEILGVPCFLMEYIEGEPLRESLCRHYPRAEEIFLNAVTTMQAVTREQLGPSLSSHFGPGCTAAQFLSCTMESLVRLTSDPLVGKIESRLAELRPTEIAPRFGNGDLYPCNILVHNGELKAIVDFEFAGFFDPLWEFMAVFGGMPLLQGRQLEERFCERAGLDTSLIPWYRAATLCGWWLGFLSTPSLVIEGCSASQCREELRKWLCEQ